MNATPRHGTALDLGIHVALPRDVDAVAAIEAASFTQPWSRRSFRALVEARNVIFLVATDAADRVQGYAVVYVAADQSELANLAVTRERRGEGYGRRLLVQCMAAARERGARTMFLEVRESNRSAQELYRSVGFHPVSRRRRYYEEPVEDALVLRHDFAVEQEMAAVP